MAAAAILDFQKFKILTEGRLCIKIGQTVADIWPFNGFFSKWRLSAILMITGGLYLEIHLKAELTLTLQ